MRDKRKNTVHDAILDTASKLFYQQGYNSTGINQIIEESGVVKSSMYQVFRSKEDILMAYLENAGEVTNNALLSVTTKPKTPDAKIIAVFDYLEEVVQQKEYCGCNFLNIVSEVPKDAKRIRKQIKKQKDNVRNLFKTILEPVGKANLADDIYLLFEGALIANKVHDEIWPVKKARDIAKILLKK